MKMGSVRGGNRGVIGSVKSAVWMIGMGYLFFTGNWFPGIFYLIGFSILLEVVLKLVFASTLNNEELDTDGFEPPLAIDEDPLTSAPTAASSNTRMQRLDPDPIPPAAPLSREYRTDLLPPKCPSCGAPISERDVEMVGIKTAKCGYCGAHFGLKE